MRVTEDLGIGVMVRLAVPVENSFRNLRAFGLRHCQFGGVSDAYLYGAEGHANTRKLMELMDEYDVASCSVFCSFPDQDWNRAKETVGLTPPATRAERIARACRTADWAKELGIEQIAVHVGYIPVDDYAQKSGFSNHLKRFFREIDNTWR